MQSYITNFIFYPVLAPPPRQKSKSKSSDGAFTQYENLP
jgi:hypothetical protein